MFGGQVAVFHSGRLSLLEGPKDLDYGVLMPEYRNLNSSWDRTP